MVSILNRTRIPLWTLALTCVLLAAHANAGAGRPTNRKLETRVVDGLGRPVKGVQIRVTWDRKVFRGEPDFDSLRQEAQARNPDYFKAKLEHRNYMWGEVELARMRTDVRGVASATLARRHLPNGLSYIAEISKEGFESYSTDLRRKFELIRTYSESEAKEVLEQRPIAKEALRELLATDWRSFLDDEHEDLASLVFYHQEAARPALRALQADPWVGDSAIHLIEMLAEPEDIRNLLDSGLIKDEEFSNDSWIVRPMFTPESETEWNFLEACAMGEDFEARSNAVATLRLIANERSRDILQRALSLNVNKFEAEEIQKALSYIDSNPPALASEDMEKCIRTVAKAVAGERKWLGETSRVFSATGDKVRVGVRFLQCPCVAYQYLILHQNEGVWRLRGIEWDSIALYGKDACADLELEAVE